MVLHVFISLLGGVPLCIPYGLYSGTSLGGTTRGTLEGYPGRVLSVTQLLNELQTFEAISKTRTQKAEANVPETKASSSSNNKKKRKNNKGASA